MSGRAVLTEVAAAERAQVVSHPDYKIHVTLPRELSDETFQTTTRVTFACSRPGASVPIDIEADEILEATLNGRAVDLTKWRKGQLPLTDLQENNVLEVRSVHPLSSAGRGLTRVADDGDGNVPYFHTQFEDYFAHTVFPCFDQPSIKGTATWTVDAPQEWNVRTNTPAVATSDLGDGMQRREFATTETIPTYEFAFVAGTFKEWKDTFTSVDGREIPLALACRRSQAQYLEPYVDLWFDILKESMAFLEEYNQVPYPFPQYDQVLVPGFKAGAMENPGLVTFYEQLIFRGAPTASMMKYLRTVIRHEGSHVNGFGDIRTMVWWDNLWLNETFATFMAAIMARELDHSADSGVTGVIDKLSAARQDQMPTNHPVETPVRDTSTVDDLFDAITYEKGFAAMFQLEAVLGKEAFRDGVRRYFRNKWDNTVRNDLINALQEASPSGPDLHAWAKQWLEAKGMSVLSPKISTGRVGRMKSFAVEQSLAVNADPVLRTHSVDIGLYDLVRVKGSHTRRLRLRTRVQTTVAGKLTEVPELAGKKRADLALINDRDTTFAKVTLDNRSLATAERYLGTLSDPLTRAQLWSTMWHYTRDAGFSATRFVNMVCRQAKGETEPLLLGMVLGQAQSAIASYAAPEHRDALRERLTGVARTQMKNTQFNATLRRSWFDAYVSLTASARESANPGDVRYLRRLLDGDVTLQGIKVSSEPELRWKVLTALASTGNATEAEIRAEGERDNSVQGKVSFTQALASLPTLAAKEAAYRRLMTDRKLTPQLLRGLLAGFASADRSLRDQFTSRFADDVVQLCRTGKMEEVVEILGKRGRTSILPPAGAAGVAAVEAALAKPASEIPDSARRVLIEGLDDMKRALAGQRADAGRAIPGAEMAA
jgi:aminopeptidase N